MQKILFTGGGSAGHVVPNVALIEQLLSEGNCQPYYIGTDGIEKSLISPWKIPFATISCPKLIRGGGFAGFKKNIQIPFAFRRAVKEAENLLRNIQPDVIFSKGGYVALPVVVAGKRLKIPCYAHESDFSMGLANKLSTRYCKQIFTSFPETAKRCKRGLHSGSIIRRSVFSPSKAEARRKWNIPFDRKTVLVFGGGSGSARINESIRANLNALCEKYAVIHVCGKGNLSPVTRKNYYQTEFIEDMGTAYACADVVISRAGSGTVFELLALKKPAVLIPLEGQTRGDQLENAWYFTKRGLCYTLKQNRLQDLPKTLDKLFADEALKSRLAESNFSAGNAMILRALQSERRG